MPRKLIAALCAALTFAAVLAVVPLATAEPAEAHECAPGQSHNGGPNGLSNPNNGHLYCWTNPPVTTTTAPPTTEPPKPKPKSCPAGQHSNYGAGKNCHANHDYSNIPCGTGTWRPHPGHSAVKRPPCKQTITYTVKPCSSVQEPLQVVRRHKHGLGGTCHRVDVSHCPAGHTEQGGHGSQDCRKNDVPDNVFTRIQHLLQQGGKAALDAVVETLKNEAADQLAGLDIDWENFGTDGDEQQKLLNVLNPVLKQNNIETYTIDDVKSLWADIDWYGRAGAGAAACGAAVDATMAKLTKGRSLKPKARAAVKRSIEAACGIGAASVPVPDNDGTGDDDDSESDSENNDNEDSKGDGHPGGTDDENNDNEDSKGDGHPGGTDDENNNDDGEDSPDAVDNDDYHFDGGQYARKMCTQYSVEYFCNLIDANEQ
ncbi:MAG: hypothetical protein OXH86_06845 [Acidimicrobiaceae bacterium]|nr:hypothetical protein [Acidimicrobiaceae bacterium]MDE0497051.1 hypothetical protein [Acidimicrobiaceae bacterium]